IIFTLYIFFFSSRRRHTRSKRDWSSDVCSSDLSYQNQKSKGILSVQPYHKVEKRYENLSAVFNIIVLTGVNVFTYWKSKFKTAGSLGPCILCDKKSYFQTGGHAWAEESIMDDFALTKLFLNENLPVT